MSRFQMARDTPKRIGIRRSPDLNRAVYQRFLESDYPEALRLAELVLEENPTDAIAQAVRDQCVLALKKDTVPAPASVKSRVMQEEAEEAEEDDEGDDDTTPELVEDESDEPTGPTLSLANRNEATRELYRLYLASEYAPALELAEELLAIDGDSDAMVRAIATECRLSLDARRSVPVLSLPPAQISEISPNGLDTHTAFVLAQIDGQLSIEEVANMSGMPLDDVLSLLDRFVAMGVLTLRPPPPPS
jgi:hypothetical protein